MQPLNNPNQHPLHGPNLFIEEVYTPEVQQSGLPTAAPSIVGEPPDQILELFQFSKSINPNLLNYLRPSVKNRRILSPGRYFSLEDELLELLEREYPDHPATQVMRQNKETTELYRMTSVALLAIG